MNLKCSGSLPAFLLIILHPLSMNNAINGRAWSGSVRILPLEPRQSVEIGVASLPDIPPAAKAFLSFLKSHPAFAMHGTDPSFS